MNLLYSLLIILLLFSNEIYCYQSYFTDKNNRMIKKNFLTNHFTSRTKYICKLNQSNNQDPIINKSIKKNSNRSLLKKHTNNNIQKINTSGSTITLNKDKTKNIKDIKMKNTLQLNKKVTLTDTSTSSDVLNDWSSSIPIIISNNNKIPTIVKGITNINDDIANNNKDGIS